jgi:hypothetical protein
MFPNSSTLRVFAGFEEAAFEYLKMQTTANFYTFLTKNLLSISKKSVNTHTHTTISPILVNTRA